MVAPEAMPLDHSTSSVSSPEGAGSALPETFTFETRAGVIAIPFFVQKVCTSSIEGNVSIRIPIVCPLPVTGNPLAPYAFITSVTRYGGAFSTLVVGPVDGPFDLPRPTRFPLRGERNLLCLWASRNGCSPRIAWTGPPTSDGRLGAFWAAV